MNPRMNTTQFTFPSDCKIVLEAVFDAPAERVFKAHTDPNIMPHWWGPRRFTTTSGKMDVRPAGIVSTFMQHGLIDEYRGVVAPVAIGKGKPFFKDIKNNELNLKLFKTKTYNRGNYIIDYHSDKKEKNR
jgi:hypothetical protein